MWRINLGCSRGVVIGGDVNGKVHMLSDHGWGIVGRGDRFLCY